MESFIETISKYSLIGLEKFWNVVIWIGEATLYLAYIIITLIILWTIVYFVLKKFNPEFSNKQKEITVRILRNNFYGSEVYEASENLVESVYGAIASLINTFALIISLAFTSFTVVIAYPFRFLQNALDFVNSKLTDMREEQQQKIIKKREQRHKNRIKRKDPVPPSLDEDHTQQNDIEVLQDRDSEK